MRIRKTIFHLFFSSRCQMSALIIRIALASIGAAVAAFIAYRTSCYLKNDTNTGHQEAPPKTALCSVCLRDFSNFSRRLNLPCGHPLHPECAKLLLVQRENSCPSCRRGISPEFPRPHFPEM